MRDLAPVQQQRNRRHRREIGEISMREHVDHGADAVELPRRIACCREAVGDRRRVQGGDRALDMGAQRPRCLDIGDAAAYRPEAVPEGVEEGGVNLAVT